MYGGSLHVELLCSSLSLSLSPSLFGDLVRTILACPLCRCSSVSKWTRQPLTAYADPLTHEPASQSTWPYPGLGAGRQLYIFRCGGGITDQL